ncbi:MAG: hypothetical protein RBT19_06280 [Tenuifilaceae bacterium]|jgi:hypothetical protein|uniref:hypothetical protein n=1 Tax=Perlabentimonas gracilis TaxID=2715279 RepID=UPI00140A4BE4|nr:hypothetical protein [Perlabentimonas gracilis]MDX9769948.1 hypothetical protein [Tenuifilaceae bacterium]NHB67612.1 hypothetical protein [Perlabentimonas gracilis]
MKNIFFAFFITTALMLGFANVSKAQSEDDLVEICGMIAGDATFLKDFRIRLDAGDPPPIQRFSVILRKGIKYRFSVCNSKDYEGKVVLQLLDNNRLLATTYIVATGADHPSIEYVCTRTGAYHLFFNFRDGKPGLAVGLLSLVETM